FPRWRKGARHELAAPARRGEALREQHFQTAGVLRIGARPHLAGLPQMLVAQAVVVVGQARKFRENLLWRPVVHGITQARGQLPANMAPRTLLAGGGPRGPTALGAAVGVGVGPGFFEEGAGWLDHIADARVLVLEIFLSRHEFEAAQRLADLVRVGVG